MVLWVPWAQLGSFHQGTLMCYGQIDVGAESSGGLTTLDTQHAVHMASS